MAKKKNTFRNSWFFLLGVFGYSFFYWVTGHNYAHVFGMILIALACYILCKIDDKKESGKTWIQTRDVIFMCIGVVFDSLSFGFPFGFIR